MSIAREHRMTFYNPRLVTIDVYNFLKNDTVSCITLRLWLLQTSEQWYKNDDSALLWRHFIKITALLPIIISLRSGNCHSHFASTRRLLANMHLNCNIFHNNCTVPHTQLNGSNVIKSQNIRFWKVFFKPINKITSMWCFTEKRL